MGKMGQCWAPVKPADDYEFQALGFLLPDVAILRGLFDNMTAKKEGILTLDILLSVLELEESQIARNCFTLYDSAHNDHKKVRLATNGHLSFKQFVLLLWNFCSATVKTAGCLLFEMHDKKCKGTLITDDIVGILNDLKVPKDKIKSALHDFPGSKLFDGRYCYDVERWCAMCTKYPGFFMFFIENQTRAKEIMGGIQFWNVILSRNFDGAHGVRCPVPKYVELLITKYMQDNFENPKIRWPTLCLALILDEYYKMHEAEIENRNARANKEKKKNEAEVLEEKAPPPPEKVLLHGVPHKMTYEPRHPQESWDENAMSALSDWKEAEKKASIQRKSSIERSNSIENAGQRRGSKGSIHGIEVNHNFPDNVAQQRRGSRGSIADEIASSSTTDFKASLASSGHDSPGNPAHRRGSKASVDIDPNRDSPVNPAHRRASKGIIDIDPNVDSPANPAHRRASKGIIDIDPNVDSPANPAHRRASKGIIDIDPNVDSPANPAHRRASKGIIDIDPNVDSPANPAHRRASKGSIDIDPSVDSPVNPAHRRGSKGNLDIDVGNTDNEERARHRRGSKASLHEIVA